MFRVFFVQLSKEKVGHSQSSKGFEKFLASAIRFHARRPLTRRTVVSFRSCSEMTSRRVPVPNPKFARSPSSDFDEKDDDDDTKRATLTKGVSKQQAKIKDTNSKGRRRRPLLRSTRLWSSSPPPPPRRTARLERRTPRRRRRRWSNRRRF